ncbi:MAG TPA: hypothetical protein VHC69_03640 [Polyangiaceae bacterium]|nr:hypothetical protein [Polyangiaceae bacterium]
MTFPVDSTGLDLEEATEQLRAICGPAVEGAVAGRRRLYDAVEEHLHCSPREAKALLDTLVAKRFVIARRDLAGGVEWLIGPDST